MMIADRFLYWYVAIGLGKSYLNCCYEYTFYLIKYVPPWYFPYNVLLNREHVLTVGLAIWKSLAIEVAMAGDGRTLIKILLFQQDHLWIAPCEAQLVN